MRRILVTLALLCGVARADTLTVGLFAPSAPFPNQRSTMARITRYTKRATACGE